MGVQDTPARQWWNAVPFIVVGLVLSSVAVGCGDSDGGLAEGGKAQPKVEKRSRAKTAKPEAATHAKSAAGGNAAEATRTVKELVAGYEDYNVNSICGSFTTRFKEELTGLPAENANLQSACVAELQKSDTDFEESRRTLMKRRVVSARIQTMASPPL